MQVQVELAEGAEREIVFILGAGSNAAEAISLIQRYRGVGAARVALEEVWQFWNDKLGVLYAETPDPALNVLMNGWLPYQVLSCRMWGRSGFYQSGGAYGFRDQLQDCVALLHEVPDLARQHLLRCAERQFAEGDVQHWWHPPGGRGVRTSCSDDYLWLPYAVCRYVAFTGDTGVLDEQIPYLAGRAAQRRRGELLRPAGPLRPDRHPLRALHAGHPQRPEVRGARPAADGQRRLERRDEPRRPPRPGRERLAGVLPARGAVAVRRPGAAAGRRGLRRALPGDRPPARGQRRRARLGRPVVPPRLLRQRRAAGLAPERRMPDRLAAAELGHDLPASASPSAAGRRWMPCGTSWCARISRSSSSSRRRSTSPPSSPATSRGTCRACARTAGSTPTRAVWAAMAFALAGRTEQASALVSMLNPINHALDPQAVERYKVEPYVLAADVYTTPPHAGRGGWTWYTGSAAGSTGCSTR